MIAGFDIPDEGSVVALAGEDVNTQAPFQHWKAGRERLEL
jgi:ABC-type thiamine transport system ATPase subunit